MLNFDASVNVHINVNVTREQGLNVDEDFARTGEVVVEFRGG